MSDQENDCVKIFGLTKEQYEKYIEWSDHCQTYSGAIGGRHTFCFTSTGLGDIATVKCICGEKLDLTDYSDW